MTKNYDCETVPPKNSLILNLDGIVKSRFKDWIPAPRLRGDRLGGYDACYIYLILIVLLSFPCRACPSEGRGGNPEKWENSTFYEIVNLAIDSKGGLLPMDPTVKRFNTTPLEYLSQEQMRDIHSATLQVLGDHAMVIHHEKKERN